MSSFPEIGPSGWSVRPTRSRWIHLSPSGSDTGDGSIAKPYKSFDKVIPLIQSGDNVRFEAGGVYPYAGFNRVVSGVTFEAYGDLSKPLPNLLCDVTRASGFRLFDSADLCFFDLDLSAMYRDYAAPDFKNVNGKSGFDISGTNNVLIEGTTVRLFGQNLTVTGGGDGLRVNRSRIANAYAYSPPSGAVPFAQGAYVDGYTGVEFWECIIEGNGWSPIDNSAGRRVGDPMFNHGLYIDNDGAAGPADVINCIVCGNAGGGVQLRPGGRILNTVFWNNGGTYEAFVGKFDGEIGYCVSAGMTGRRPGDYGGGFMVQSHSARVHHNLCCNKTDARSPAFCLEAIKEQNSAVPANPGDTAEFSDNVVDNWLWDAIQIVKGRPVIRWQNNRVLRCGRKLVNVSDPNVTPAALLFNGNQWMNNDGLAMQGTDDKGKTMFFDGKGKRYGTLQAWKQYLQSGNVGSGSGSPSGLTDSELPTPQAAPAVNPAVAAILARYATASGVTPDVRAGHTRSGFDPSKLGGYISDRMRVQYGIL